MTTDTFEEAPKLVGTRVRVVLRRNFREMPVDIMRGIVTHNNESGITISGRHFQEVQNNVTGDFEEHPLSHHTKIYFIPFNSIKYIDYIIPGSRTERLADKVEKHTVLESPVKEYTFTPKLSKRTEGVE